LDALLAREATAQNVLECREYYFVTPSHASVDGIAV
jgi:hypothetical protein